MDRAVCVQWIGEGVGAGGVRETSPSFEAAAGGVPVDSSGRDRLACLHSFPEGLVPACPRRSWPAPGF